MGAIKTEIINILRASYWCIRWSGHSWAGQLIIVAGSSTERSLTPLQCYFLCFSWLNLPYKPSFDHSQNVSCPVLPTAWHTKTRTGDWLGVRRLGRDAGKGWWWWRPTLVERRCQCCVLSVSACQYVSRPLSQTAVALSPGSDTF